MGKCIRCGKPCADGEQMCDDCKAWFQQKTGGTSFNTRQTTTFVSKRKPLSQKKPSGSSSYSSASEESDAQTTAGAANSAAGAQTAAETANSAAGAQTTAGAANSAAGSGSGAPAGKGLHVSFPNVGAAKAPAGNGKPAVDKKIIGIVAGAAVVVVVLAIAIGGGKGKKQHTEVAAVPETVEQTADTAEQTADTAVSTTDAEVWTETETESESVAWTPDDATMELIGNIDAYTRGIDDAKLADTLTKTTVEGTNLTLYYRDEKLVCVQNRHDIDLLDYYYDTDGGLLYAQTYDEDAYICYFYYDAGQLMCWKNYDTGAYYPDLSECRAKNAENYVSEAMSYLAQYPYQNTDAEYVFPHSDTELIKASDLEGMDAWHAKLARNEIIARHGRKFTTPELKEYFEKCSWYTESMEPEEFDKNYESILNSIEKENINTIKEYEKKMGYTN